MTKTTLKIMIKIGIAYSKKQIISKPLLLNN
ncbi:hypothetical protein [Acinetobacter phage Ab69]|nr:hypothetical protein [Acinetobacter phage Ab69]